MTTYGQKLYWVKRKNLGEKVVMQLMFDSGGAAGELWKIIWCLGLKGVAVADSDWDEDDWGSGWAERRFELVKEDGGGDMIKDDCDKYDDDDCDDCGDNTSCNV